MQLYTILLVDDEEEVRKSIALKLDWEDLGFEMVGQAENGEDAFEKIELLMPDVVFTDISMPYMNGLELAQKLKKFYPSIKVVVFSGHDEFDYAKQAISFQVLDYILKPINKEELTDVFIRLHNKLEEEVGQKRSIKQLRESFVKNIPVLRQKFLVDLINDNVEETSILGGFEEYLIDFREVKTWVSIKVSFYIINKEQSLSLHKENELLAISIKQILDEKITGFCKNITFQNAQVICGIIGLSKQQDLMDFITVLTDASREIRRILQVNIFIGVGRPKDKVEQLAQSFQEASNALGFQKIHETENVIYINDVEPNKKRVVIISSAIQQDYFSAVKENDEEKLKIAINAILKELEDGKLHHNQYQLFVLDIFSLILGFLKKYEIEIDDVFDEDTDYISLIDSLIRNNDLHNWLTMIGRKMYTALSDAHSMKNKKFVVQAKRYIIENFTDIEMSLEQVCNHLHISPTYFSSVFKKETGESYIGYLTKLRMEKAVELLNTTDDKTYMIAEKIGYAEPNYFGYVFKKQYGVSPAKYRSR